MEGVDGSEKSILHGDGGLLSAVVGGGEDATVGPDSMGHAACAGATRVGGPGSSAPPRPAVAGCTSPGSSSPSVRRAREGSGQRTGEGMKAAWTAGEGSSQPRRQCSGGGAPAVQQPCPIRAAGSAGKSGNCPPEPAGDGSGGGSSGSGRTAVDLPAAGVGLSTTTGGEDGGGRR